MYTTKSNVKSLNYYRMKRNHVLILVLIAIGFSSCKKDDNNPDAGQEEGKKIEAAVIGHNYKISSITNQTGADASAQFPTCISDDIYYIKDRGTVEIVQGAQQCGTHTQDKVNSSWGLGYSENAVASLFFPVFLKSYSTYKENEFSKGLFSVNQSTGEINLQFKVDVNTYTIKLIQTL